MPNVHVNKQDWDKLSKSDQDKITEIMRTSGLIARTDMLVGAAAPQARAAKFADANPTCVFGCNAAETVAVSACALLPPPGNMICVAIAHAAAEFCRSKC
jgi:hypothetical protein